MQTFLLGQPKITKRKLQKLIQEKVEKLVAFFGEEHRAQIEQNINNTTFILINRHEFKSEAERVNLIRNLLNDTIGDFTKFMPTHRHIYTSGIYNEELIKEIRRWAKTKNVSVKDNPYFRAYCISYLQQRGAFMYFTEYIKENFNNPEFIKEIEKEISHYDVFAGLKTFVEASKTKDFKKQYKEYKLHEEEEYFGMLKFDLNSEELACFKMLESAFGKHIRDINIASDFSFMDYRNIAQVFLKFIKTDSELLFEHDKLMFAKMFNLLTNQNKSYDEYLLDDQLMGQCESIRKKLAVKVKLMRKKRKNLDTFKTIENLLSQDKFADKILYDMFEYSRYRDNSAAYFAPSLNQQGDVQRYIVLPEINVEYSITHEMIHSMAQSNKNACNTGVLLNENLRALNEVLTEFFAVKAEHSADATYYSQHYVTYSAAFAIFKPFLEDNLELLKWCYITNNMNPLIERYGVHNVVSLIDCLKALLYTEPTNNYTATSVKKYLKGKDHYIPAIENCIQVMQQLSNLTV